MIDAGSRDVEHVGVIMSFAVWEIYARIFFYIQE